MGRALASKLQGTEPMGDSTRIRQHKGRHKSTPGLGVGLEKPSQLANDEGGLGAGGDSHPKGDGLEDQPLSRLPGNMSS